MPLSEQHKQKKQKNYTMLAILLALFVLLFAITVMRLGNMPQ
jgi:hypothetical protein